MTENDPNQCPEMDSAMNEQCTRIVGHEGPHDALGEPNDNEVSPTFEDEPENLPVPEEPQPEPVSDPVTSVPVDMAANPNLAEGFEGKVAKAARNLALTGGEMVDYAVGMTVAPDQNGGPRPLMVLTIFVPSLTIGQKAYMTGLVENFYLSQDEVNVMITEMVQGLVQARQNQASLIQQQQVQQNGLKQSVEGLIHPGQPG